MVAITERGLHRKAVKAGRVALDAISSRLRETKSVKVEIKNDATIVTRGGLSVWLRAQPEKPNGHYNGKVRITLMRNGVAQRQFPETTRGVDIDKVVAVTLERLGQWEAQAEVGQREDAFLASLMFREQSNAQRVGAVLRLSESGREIEVVIPVHSAATLDAILGMLAENSV